MHRVVHFELGVESPQRAVKFYEQVFNWKIQKLPGPQEYFFVVTGSDQKPGINGGIMRHKDGMPRTVNTIEVPSVDEFTDKVSRSGGKVVVPKMAIPSVGWQSYCQDTEGNLFGIHQADPAAK